MSTIYILMLYPVWYVRPFLIPPFGTLFLLAELAIAAMATALRLHLVFLARSTPNELNAQLSSTALATRYCDIALAVIQISAALAIGEKHPEFAMLFVGVSAATLIASLVIEPATTRGAFGGGKGGAG
jgi:hypothetical protein